MPSRKLVAVVVLVAVAAGCRFGRHGVSGNTASFGQHSNLESQYVYEGSDEPVPVCHVLFVPQWDPPPRINVGFQYGGGGDGRRFSYHCAYLEQGVKQFDTRVTATRPFLFADTFE